MSSRTNLTTLRVISALLVVLAVTGTASAVQWTVTVGDAGFDDYVLSPGGYIDIADPAYTGPWKCLYGYAWIGNGYWAANGWPQELEARSGDNIAYGDEDLIYQILDETFIEGVTYTLSVWVGQPWAEAIAWSLYFTEEDPNNNLIAASGSAPKKWGQVSLTYTATATDAGKKIGIKMYGDIDVSFEDVTLSYDYDSAMAMNPIPADGATDVCSKVVLSWTPGPYADKHDVYFGTNFDDVNDGVGGVTQDPNSYPIPETLDFGQTYYWRIDEVNAPPDYTIFKGDIWQFTTESIAYPIAGDKITATVSSSKAADEGPENTINGSGLDGDLHSAVTTDMWLSGSHQPGEAWIKYEFDNVYKLHEMWVWNYNSESEPFLGYGLKDVTIEYSENGTDYTTLGTTHEFAQAPGEPGYEHNTEVPLEGVVAKYVRLTANSNWGGFLNQYGLSEVRFFRIPVRAREPNPEDGTTGVGPDVVLSWIPGRDADTHNLYLSTDEQAVTQGTISPSSIPAADGCRASYGPLSLEMDMTYYWRIDEVNDADTWKGDIWSFRTKLFIPITDPNLIGWWKFDEDEGTVALDWSGHDNHGVLFGDPLWVAGIIGDALQFDGDGYVEMVGYKGVVGTQSRTCCAWIKTETSPGEILYWGQNNAGIKWGVCLDGGRLRLEVNNGYNVGSTDMRDAQWHHVAVVLIDDGSPDVTESLLYVDGVREMIASSSDEPINTASNWDVRIALGNHDYYFNGQIDDVRIYDKALTEAEIGRVMSGDPHLAWNPNPADGAMVSVEEANSLSWSPGDEAVSHDVYFGTDEAAVASATLASPEFKANQPDTTYPLAGLEMETTYYWRIDEVNDADTWTGDIWSFTTGKVYYVDADAEGANDGSNWADAYNDLQDALTVAWNGDEIRVAQGVYKPDGPAPPPPPPPPSLSPVITTTSASTGDREATFQLINGVIIKGGYAGFDEPDPDARDIGAYETILSGDLNGDDGPNFANNGENSYHVVTGSGTNETAVLDGFTITGGNANGSSDITVGMICHWKFDEGQGSIAYDSAGNNHGTVYGAQWTTGQIGTSLDFYGPGRYVTIDPAALSPLAGGSEVTVALWQYGDIGQPTNTTTFQATYSSNPDNRVIGAQIAWWDIVYWDTVNAGNWNRLSKAAQSHEYKGRWNHWTFTKDASAGEMKIYLNGSLWASATGKHNLLAKAVFFKIGSNINGQENYGGRIDDMRIYNRALSAEEIQRLYSMGEDRKYGGGMYNDSGSPTLTNCTFSGNQAEKCGGGMANVASRPTVRNCMFSGNSAETGGGMANFINSPTVTNCTFNGNSAYRGGGMCNLFNSNPTVTNCTFSGNRAEHGGGMYNENSSPTLTNCILWGNIDSGGMDESAQISGAAILNYCCIQGYVEPSTQGLISHWKFDEGQGSIAYDSAGNNDGTVYGAEWTTGQIGGALEFDGVDDYVEATDSPDLDITDGITIGMWIKPYPGMDCDGGNNWRYLLHKRSWGAYDLIYEASWHVPLIGFTVTVGGTDYRLWTNTAAYPGEFAYLAFTYDAQTGEQKTYFNGNLDSQQITAGGFISTNNGPLRIGGGENTGCPDGAGFFNGLIDGVAIYYRALSAEEVWQFYLRGFGENQGNIDSNPWFVEPGYWDANGVWVDGDYHLLPDSPCINAGDPNYVAEPNETDLDGKPRVIGGRIDMGAYEFNHIPVACILGGDRIVECGGCWGARVTLDGSCSSDADSTPGTNDDIVSFDWYKVDACDPNFEDFLASGEIIDCNLPLGEHIIVLEVTDKAGAFDTNEVTIIVQDTTPPEFTLSVTPTMLWPANHKMVLITPSWTASDICDASPEVSLVSITMNEGDEAKGDGHTAGDIQTGDDGSIYLRAERSGTGSGRIYTITYQAVDDSGNVAVASATVTVPHDQR